MTCSETWAQEPAGTAEEGEAEEGEVDAEGAEDAGAVPWAGAVTEACAEVGERVAAEFWADDGPWEEPGVNTILASPKARDLLATPRIMAAPARTSHGPRAKDPFPRIHYPHFVMIKAGFKFYRFNIALQ